MSTPRTTIVTAATTTLVPSDGPMVPDAETQRIQSSEAYKAWQDILRTVHRRVRLEVVTVIRTGVEQLTQDFYDRMLADERAHAFLQPDQVQTRLKRMLQHWIVELFSANAEGEIVQAIRRQVDVGVMHARIRLPADLISSGIRVVRRQIRRRIEFAALDHVERIVANTLVSDLLHLADGLMIQAYIRDIEDVSRKDEAYRQILQTTNLTHEHSRQRAVLAEWVETLMMAVWEGTRPLPRLRESAFGVWLHHKGAILFENMCGLEDLRLAVQVLDQNLLPRLESVEQDASGRSALFGAVKENISIIRLHISESFERMQASDSGLDAETQMADRRYLPAVLGRVIQAHRDNGRTFTLTLINVAARVPEGRIQNHAQRRLMQVAAHHVIDGLRSTDHVFRYGDTQCLVIAIETPKTKAQQLAIALRERLIHGLQSTSVNGMVSPMMPSIEVGIAEYDGHPDYHYLLQRVESALRDAARTRQGIGIAT